MVINKKEDGNNIDTLTDTQILVVKELYFQSTEKIVIQHILHMLDTPDKVEQMK